MKISKYLILYIVTHATISFAAVPPSENLIIAIVNQNLPAVQQYIAAHGNVNVKAPSQAPAIVLAAIKPPVEHGSFNPTIALNMVNALIAAGANVNAACMTGYTALMAAIESNNLAMVNAFIAAKANVNAIAGSVTPLILAENPRPTRGTNGQWIPTTPNQAIISALKAAGAK